MIFCSAFSFSFIFKDDMENPEVRSDSGVFLYITTLRCYFANVVPVAEPELPLPWM